MTLPFPRPLSTCKLHALSLHCCSDEVFRYINSKQLQMHMHALMCLYDLSNDSGALLKLQTTYCLCHSPHHANTPTCRERHEVPKRTQKKAV